jgi:hypothetical protein
MQGRRALDYLYPFAVRVEMVGVRLTLKAVPHLLLHRKPHYKEISVDAKDGRHVRPLYMEEPVEALASQISVGYRRDAKFLQAEDLMKAPASFLSVSSLGVVPLLMNRVFEVQNTRNCGSRIAHTL